MTTFPRVFVLESVETRLKSVGVTLEGIAELKREAETKGEDPASYLWEFYERLKK